MNENEKNPLLNMQRIIQESLELSEASTNENNSVSKNKAKKEKTVNARQKHEQRKKASVKKDEEKEVSGALTEEKKKQELQKMQAQGKPKLWIQRRLQ